MISSSLDIVHKRKVQSVLYWRLLAVKQHCVQSLSHNRTHCLGDVNGSHMMMQTAVTNFRETFFCDRRHWLRQPLLQLDHRGCQ